MSALDLSGLSDGPPSPRVYRGRMTDPATAPTLTLNNGVTMPALGLGVYQSAPEDTAAAVEAALRTGYRHIDTAAAYGNEKQVGEGLRASGVPREDVFLETKVWVSDYGYDKTLHAFEKSSAKLGVDVIDLLILHQPAAGREEDVIGAYKALEKLLADGKVRAIGVSNFMPAQLDTLIGATDIVPAVNQIELHPYFTQADVQAADAQHGILTQAWSPIGGITFYRDGKHTSALEDPTILEIAKAHDATPAQVMLAWHLAQGRSAIPKSIRPERIAENFGALGIELSDDELARLDALDTGMRGGPDPLQPQPSFFDLVIPEA